MKEITNKTLKIILFSELRSILNRKFDEMKQNFGAFILMRNYNKIDQQKQLQVACNAGAGLTTPENANISNVSKSTVSRILQIMKNWDKPNSNSDTLSQFRFHFVPMNIKSSHITNIEISQSTI